MNLALDDTFRRLGRLSDSFPVPDEAELERRWRADKAQARFLARIGVAWVVETAGEPIGYARVLQRSHTEEVTEASLRRSILSPGGLYL